MKIQKKLIKKIISEEVKNALFLTKKLKNGNKSTKLDHLREELIKLFIDHRQKITSMSIKSKKSVMASLEIDINDIKDKYGLGHMDFAKFFVFCVHILNGRADPQLITFIKTLARGDRRFGSYLDKLDSYDHSISPEEEKYQPAIRKDPDPGFMRVPKSDNAIDDQEDLRRDRKTLTQSENLQLDEGLKEFAKEVAYFAKWLYKETKEVLQFTYSEIKKEVAQMNLTHDKATKAIEEWKNLKRIKTLFDQDPEVKELIFAGNFEEASKLMITKGNLSLEDQSRIKNVYKWIRQEYLTGKAELAKIERQKKAAERRAMAKPTKIRTWGGKKITKKTPP